MLYLKNYPVLLLLLLGSHPIAAQYQPLAIEHAHWRIHVDDVETLWQDQIYEYICRGDTTLDDQVYKKIYRRDFVYEPEPFPGHYPLPYRVEQTKLFGLIREDTTSRKVWAILAETGDNCLAGNEFLLFDFGVQVGDTLNGCIFLDIGPTVWHIDQYDYNGWGERKVFEYTDGILLEGIGSMFGLFETAMPNVSGYSIQLIDHCIGSDESCGLLVSDLNHAVSQNETIRFYPNPFRDQLIIDGQKELAHIRLLAPDGRQVLKKRAWGVRAILNLRHLPPGLYILEVRTADGTHRVYRTLKQ